MSIDVFGKILIFVGIIIILVGLILFAGGKFLQLGRLPGDIIIRKEDFTFYFPLATSILISIVLSIIFYLISRLSK
jgi:hypothetical protein